MRRENGITLIALIITIIILVILAAVSIRAVYNMGIVDYAVNGTQNYAKAAVAENKMLDSTGTLIEDTLSNIDLILKSGVADEYSILILNWYDETSNPPQYDDIIIALYKTENDASTTFNPVVTLLDGTVVAAENTLENVDLSPYGGEYAKIAIVYGARVYENGTYSFNVTYNGETKTYTTTVDGIAQVVSSEYEYYSDTSHRLATTYSDGTTNYGEEEEHSYSGEGIMIDETTYPTGICSACHDEVTYSYIKSDEYQHSVYISHSSDHGVENYVGEAVHEASGDTWYEFDGGVESVHYVMAHCSVCDSDYVQYEAPCNFEDGVCTECGKPDPNYTPGE